MGPRRRSDILPIRAPCSNRTVLAQQIGWKLSLWSSGVFKTLVTGSVGVQCRNQQHCASTIWQPLIVTGILRGVSTQFGQGDDEICKRSTFRQYAGLTAVVTARPRQRSSDVFFVNDALEEDGMRHFLAEQRGRVPTIESVYIPLREYIRAWLWEMGKHCPLSDTFSTPTHRSAGHLQRLACTLRSSIWTKCNYRSSSHMAGGAVGVPLQSLRSLIRLGEGSSDPSFDRLAQLRAVVSPSPRPIEFLLGCEDDILESILQTSISLNRLPLVVFWLIAAFRCGFRKDLLSVISTRLDRVWELCVELQNDDATEICEVDELDMYKSGYSLHLLWTEVFQGIREARMLFRESGPRWMSSCFGCGEYHESLLRQERTLSLSKFLDGHVDAELANSIKCAALD